MKSFKLSILISALMLTIASMANAETSTGHEASSGHEANSGHEESAKRLNQKFKSKRPYHAPVDLKKSNKEAEQFEGSALVPNNEESVESKKAYNQNRLKANKTSRRHHQ